MTVLLCGYGGNGNLEGYSIVLLEGAGKTDRENARLLQETGDGRVYLTDWDNYRFHFN